MTYHSTTFKQRSRKILGIALPAGLNSLLDISNIVIGIFLVSKLSSYHIIALGLGLNFFMLLYALTNIFYVGTNAQISRLYGKRDFEGIKRVLSSMFFGAFILSFPIYFIADGLYSTYFSWIGVDETSQALGEIFVNIILFTIPALFTKIIIISSLSALGNTKTPFFIKLIITILNLALNYIFIFVFTLDIVGIALSNIIVSYLELIILLAYLLKKNIKLKMIYSFSLKIFKNGVRIGFPVGLERSFTIISLILISKFVASYGSDYLAGFQIGARIEAFAFMPSFGFMVASMALTGQYLGANKKILLKQYIYTTIILASIFMGLMGFIMAVFGENLSSIFDKNSDIIYSSANYLLCVGLSQIPLVFIFVLDGAYRGAGATKISLYVNTISIWTLRILPMYLCVLYKIPLLAIYMIILIETFIRGLAFLYIFRKYFEKIFV
ncbi:MAG: MATE family efflux transporter [Helicobacteraceae bacterium]|nr:MATE family efflux transporter [Helicobacteraceae bacterium]